jgi:ribonuclease HI
MPLQPAPEDYVKIFTDGACSGNPGPGGWAFIMEHPASGKRIERAGAEPLTTNNRMEITSALQGLILLKRPCRVEIVTDSQYLAKGILEWLPGWKANGFRRREGHQFKPLQNEDLWRAVDEQLQRHVIQVMHVRGHSGHPENERCDQMAVTAYKRLMAGTLAAATPSSQKYGDQVPQAQVRSNPALANELRQAEITPARQPEKANLAVPSEIPIAVVPENQPDRPPEQFSPTLARVAEPVASLKTEKSVKSSSRKSAPEPELIFDMLAAPVPGAPEKEKPTRRKPANRHQLNLSQKSCFSPLLKSPLPNLIKKLRSHLPSPRSQKLELPQVKKLFRILFWNLQNLPLHQKEQEKKLLKTKHHWTIKLLNCQISVSDSFISSYCS